MLTIKIGDKELVMFRGTKLRFEIASPIFEANAIPGSYICPFDLPVNGNDVFENAEFIEVNRIYKKYNCVVYIDGFPLYGGELILNNPSPNKYRCSVILTGINTDFAEKPLNELDYGSDIVVGGSPHSATTVATMAANANLYNLYDFYFPVIHAVNFYGSSDDYELSPANADYGGEIVLGAGKTGKYINNWNAELQRFEINSIRGNVDLADNAYVLVPQFKLVYIIKKIFENTGYKISGDFMSNAFINKLLFLNYFALDGKYAKHLAIASTVTRHTNNTNAPKKIVFSDETSIGNEDIDNHLSINSGNTIFLAMESGFHQFELICKSKITFSDVQNIFPGGKLMLYIVSSGLTIETGEADLYSYNSLIDCHITVSIWMDAGQQVTFQYGFVSNGYPNAVTFGYVESGAKLVGFNASYKNLNQYANKLHTANHVTTNTVGAILNAIKANFGLAMWFDMDGKEVEISFLKDLLKSYNYIDISEMAIKNSLDISLEEAKGYKITQKNDDEAKDVKLYENIGSFVKKSDLPTPDKLNVIAEVLQEGCIYKYKKNDSDFTLNWEKYGTSVSEIAKGKAQEETAMEIGIMTNVLMQNRLLPDSKQQGTSEYFETGVNETDMQLLIWHGMQADKNGLLYPFASSLKYNAAGNEISDNELRLDGESGTYEMFLKEWYDFMNNAETIRLQLKFKSDILIKLLQIFKPQSNKTTHQCRKVKYNGSIMLPKNISFLIPTDGEIIEAELEAYKDGGVEL